MSKIILDDVTGYKFMITGKTISLENKYDFEKKDLTLEEQSVVMISILNEQEITG